MPEKKIAWSCSFKCGRNVLTSKKRMKDHETKCWWNPCKKACVSCAYFHRGIDSNGMEHEPQNLQTWQYRECTKGNEIEEKLRNNCNDYKKSNIGDVTEHK